MSGSSKLRDLTVHRCSRSCSPTKKSPQYRNTVLKPANIHVDVVHEIPPRIEALLPNGLRDLLNDSSTVPLPMTHTHTEDADEYNSSRAGEVYWLSTLYRNECRELARKTGSEPDY
jgi:hypothetical protein